MGRFAEIELDGLELHGARITLRPWRPADADAVRAVMADRSMHEFLALPDPYTAEDAARFITESGHGGRSDGTGLGSAVVETATGRLVGSAALRLTGDRDLGYWIAPDARGRGYAAEACRILTDWAFAHGLRRVQLFCDVRNLGSAHTALAAGFRFEGLSRDFLHQPLGPAGPDRPSDLARFARLASDAGTPVPPTFVALPLGGLRDDVLAVRTICPSDADAIAETDDPLTLEWGFTGAPHTADEVRRMTDRAGLDWLVGGVAGCSMVDLATGRVAGSLVVRHAGPPAIGGIGYVVHPDFRGRGYTTRALRLLIPWAFEQAGFARLELGAKVGNIASQKVALAAGFVPDGIRERRLRNPDGSFSDEARFALLNPRYA